MGHGQLGPRRGQTGASEHGRGVLSHFPVSLAQLGLSCSISPPSEVVLRSKSHKQGKKLQKL